MEELKTAILERKLKRFALFLFFLVVFLSYVYPVRDADTPWHVKTGEYIVMNRTIPVSSDPFSFATGKISSVGRFILSQNWLAQALFFITYRSMGPLGLVLTRAVVFTLIVSIIWYLVERKNGFFIAMLSAGTASFFILRYFAGIRSQIFTFLFSAAVILMIEKYKDTRSVKWLSLLPFIMILWANMHGGFIYGIVLIFIYLFGEAAGFVLKDRLVPPGEDSLSAKQIVLLLAFGLLSLLVSMINPNTYEAFVFTFMSHAQGYNVHTLSQGVAEYQSALTFSKTSPPVAVYGFWVCLICAVGMAVVFVRRRQVTPLLLLLFALSPALVAKRYIPLFLIVAAPLAAYLPRPAFSKPSRELRIGIQVAVIVFFSFLAIYSNPFRDRSILRFNETFYYPVRATNFLLKSGVRGNIFPSYNTGAFVEFRCWPGSRVYFDSRFVDVARTTRSMEIEGQFDPPSEILASISRLLPAGIGTITISGGKGTGSEAKWKEMLDGINADIIVHEAVNHFSGGVYPLVFKLARDNTWKLIYADGTVMIFVRDDRKFRDIVARYELPKSRIYDEILEECSRGAGGEGEGYYSSTALALLLKGIADKHTSYFIGKALSLSPDSYIANYSKVLFLLMTHDKKDGGKHAAASGKTLPLSASR
jgi:hypothetical protein